MKKPKVTDCNLHYVNGKPSEASVHIRCGGEDYRVDFTGAPDKDHPNGFVYDRVYVAGTERSPSDISLSDSRLSAILTAIRVASRATTETIHEQDTISIPECLL